MAIDKAATEDEALEKAVENYRRVAEFRMATAEVDRKLRAMAYLKRYKRKLDKRVADLDWGEEMMRREEEGVVKMEE